MLAALAISTIAQEPVRPTITALEVQGLERVSDQVVRSKIEVQAWQTYNPRAVARDIRRLYDMGYFTNIRADAVESAGGLGLTYVLEEKRVIDEIKIIGNSKVNDRRVRGVLSWREGDSFLADGYDQEREAILDLYATKGFANAQVDIIAEKVGPSRVRITYNITEGSKARIRKIEFVGNETISDRKLKKTMLTKRAWWFIGGRYDEEKFEADLDNVVNEYGDVGRLEAAIPQADMDFTDNGKGMYITVNIEEGPEYHVDSLEIANNAVYDDDEMLEITEVQAGEVHNKSQVIDDAAAMQQGHQDSGYVNAAVTPQVTLDRENKTTHVVHNVNEGDLRYIKEVKVTGNEVTKDQVVPSS